MLNDFMNLFNGGSNVAENVKPTVQTQRVEDLSKHPSYEAGYEAGESLERGNQFYNINPSDPIHMRAFAAGYNAAISDNL